MTPPELGLVRLRIPGFAALSDSERQQAAALALHRDFGITGDGLLLATRVGATSDEAHVAYCPAGNAALGGLSTTLLVAMQTDRVFWVGAPEGYVISAQGAIALDGYNASSHALPQTVQMSLQGARQLVLVDRDANRVDDNDLALWGAASGAEVLDGVLPAGETVRLRTVPRSRIDEPPGALDRTLRWAAAAAIMCTVLAGARVLTSNATTNVVTAAAPSSASSNAQPGALFERIATIVPDLTPQLQGATYASGAWVLELPATVDAAALQRMARALQTNGLAVQSTTAPVPRLRVQLLSQVAR